MILFSVLLIMLLIIIVFCVLVVAIGGAIGVILFGDVFVCAAIIIFIMVRLWKRKHRR